MEENVEVSFSLVLWKLASQRFNITNSNSDPKLPESASIIFIKIFYKIFLIFLIKKIID